MKLVKNWNGEMVNCLQDADLKPVESLKSRKLRLHAEARKRYGRGQFNPCAGLPWRDCFTFHPAGMLMLWGNVDRCGVRNTTAIIKEPNNERGTE